MFKEACNSVDRVTDSDSESRGFNSLHAYFNFRKIFLKSLKLINLNSLHLNILI
jgi:hypothetical protein